MRPFFTTRSVWFTLMAVPTMYFKSTERPLMIGKTLGHYEIIGLLGKGGMGEVYRARDTKLDREVALKLLPPEFSQDPERVARFRREAKVLASLNHPNIATLYGLEEVDDRIFLVMELAEGEDLSQRMKRGPVPMSEALSIALQITQALEAAHAGNIVHRDLKPSNVMLLGSSQVKLLDFGLARAYQPDETSGDPALSPTITAAMTRVGLVLGTAAYMSPEQARGKSIDKQSDIWSFGIVLFEMITGHRLFEGETISDSIGAILHKDPDWSLLPTDTPPHLRQLLQRCLERDRERRLRDIGDGRVAIVDAQRDPTGSSLGIMIATDTPRSSRRRWLVQALAAATLLVLGAGIGTQLQAPTPPEFYKILDLGIDVDPSRQQNNGIQAAISPDSRGIAFVHEGLMWLQEFDEMEARQLDGSDGAFAPFWSPDASQIGWFQGGRLWKTATSGGRPVAICKIGQETGGGLGASWGDDGRIIFATGTSAIYSVSAAGGQPHEEIALREGVDDLHNPFVLPEGKGLLFVEHPANASAGRLMLWRDGDARLLVEAATDAYLGAPVYDSKGFILMGLYGGDLIRGLWAVAFDLESGTTSGELFLVEENVSSATISQSGTLAFVNNPIRQSTYVVSRFESGGTRRETLIPAHKGLWQFQLSPDGTKVVFNAEPPDGGSSQIWVYDLARDAEAQLTTFDTYAYSPMWAPDGRSIYFNLYDDSLNGTIVYRVPADGSREAEPMCKGLINLVHPDGKTAFITLSADQQEMRYSGNDSTDVWLVPTDDFEGGDKLFTGDTWNYPVDLSPDGRFLLYTLADRESSALYLTRFPQVEGRWKVSVGEGRVYQGGFRPDTSVIYYSSEDVVYEVAFESGDPPILGRPEAVVQFASDVLGSVSFDPGSRTYLISHLEKSDDSSSQSQRRAIKVVEGWTTKLDGR